MHSTRGYTRLVVVALSLAALWWSPQQRGGLIVPGERVGPVFPNSTSATLRAAIGEDAVVDRNIGMGEGEFEAGTIIYPDDPTRSLAIIWHDAERRERPKTVMVCYHPDPWSEESEPCRWRTAGGIGLGTRLSELEELNGRPFTLTGFEWDYSGTVLSWAGGRLEELLDPHGWRTLVRLAPQTGETGNWVPAVEYRAMAPVLGDHDVSSGHPLMRLLDPAVYWVELRFPAAPAPER